jgi:hypothetical protein
METRTITTDVENQTTETYMVLNKEEYRKLIDVMNWVCYLSASGLFDARAHQTVLKTAESSLSYICREAVIQEE